MSNAESQASWRRRAARGSRANPVAPGGDAKEEARRDTHRRIVTFLALTLLFTAVSASLAIGIGTGGDAGDLIALGVMWSPGLAALVTVFAFQHNLKGIGWGLGKPRYLLIGYGLPLVECSLVYGLVWMSGLGALQGDLIAAVEKLVTITPGILMGILFALGEEIGWRGLLVPQLARLTTFARTALISGLIQAVWHWPFVLFAGFTSAAPTWFALTVLTTTVTLAAFPAAWLRLRSGSIWPVVLAHASFNLYVQTGFNPLTADTGITEYIVDEFGVAFVLSGTAIAYVFWRLRHRLPDAQQGRPQHVASHHTNTSPESVASSAWGYAGNQAACPAPQNAGASVRAARKGHRWLGTPKAVRHRLRNARDNEGCTLGHESGSGCPTLVEAEQARCPRHRRHHETPTRR
jgi:membrane protease YdiL (CAAX protease family)